MKGRSGNNTGGIPTDLLVCFPSRAHLALMPKPICSPSRPAVPTKRYRSRSTHRSQSSPLFRSNVSKYSGGGASTDDIADEPTSPTVTCAGQIKVRPRSRPDPKPTNRSSRDSKGWLSVVAEMEKLQSKKPLMQFLGALRSLRFDLHCFGSFHGAVDCSTDEEEGAEEEEEAEEEVEDDKDLEGSASRTIFSKWFMLLEENQRHEVQKEMKKEGDRKEKEEEELAPPPNALLLMRCRSAPAEGRTVIEEEEEEEDLGAEMTKEKEEKEKKDRLLLMSYDPDFAKLSTEISKETWIVGNFDPLARSRSWKR